MGLVLASMWTLARLKVQGWASPARGVEGWWGWWGGGGGGEVSAHKTGQRVPWALEALV